MKKLMIILLVFTSTGILAQNYKFGKVSKEELEEKFYPLDSTANAAYLYQYRRTYYHYSPNDGYLLMTEVHVRTKIYNKEGFDKATKEIRYFKPEKGYKDKITSIKANTYNLVDGKVVKEKLSSKSIFDTKLSKNTSAKKLTMPNVKEGSVVEWKYKMTSHYAASIADLEFQYDIPVKKLYYVVSIPEALKFNTASKGFFIISPTKDGTKSKYNAENIPALKNNEPYVDNIRNYRGGMKYELTSIQFENSIPKFYSTSWGKVAQQINATQAFGDELKKTSYYKDDLATILASANNDVEKISAIYQFVKTKVRWNGYRGKYADLGVRKAYKEGVGNSADINLMLTSMLRSAGINANPVLVSTRSNGVPLFPTLDGFNYVVSIVNIGEGYVLLDATERYGVPNVLPARALNWNGRIVQQNGTSSWIPLTSSKLATENHVVTAKITDDMMVEGMLRSKFSNLSALNYRNRYNVIKEDNISSKLEEDYNIEIENFRIGNKYALGKPVSQMIKFSSEDLIEEINNKIYISPMLFFTMNNNPFKSKDRKFPVDFVSPWIDKHTISIEIPEGYTIESLPESKAIGMSERIGVFKYQIKQVGTKINLICSIQFNQGKISANYYQELKEFYKKMVEKQAEKIVLTKG
ncbi:MAG: DUF3857 domain-containing protein [Flavobacteriaceae bacterium]